MNYTDGGLGYAESNVEGKRKVKILVNLVRLIVRSYSVRIVRENNLYFKEVYVILYDTSYI